MSFFGQVADHVFSRRTRPSITGAVRTAFRKLTAWAAGRRTPASAPQQPPVASGSEFQQPHLRVVSRGGDLTADAQPAQEAETRRDPHGELLTLLYGRKPQALSDHLKGLLRDQQSQLREAERRGNITEMMMYIVGVERADDYTREMIADADAAGIKHPYMKSSQKPAATVKEAAAPHGRTGSAGQIKAAPVCGDPRRRAYRRCQSRPPSGAARTCRRVDDLRF